LPDSDRIPLDHVLAYEQLSEPTSMIPTSNSAAKGNSGVWRTYDLPRRAALTGDHISDCAVSHDMSTGAPGVSLEFTPKGGDELSALTERGVGRKLAIVLDGRVMSAPVITAKIGGGHALINLGRGEPSALEQEARDLCAVLRSGAVPGRLVLVRDEVVPPK
jgi:preprotein translocase subunit SecD